ncbi:Arylsulfatase [Klebsiella spallanzanii]|uniref:Arylsulfatase n=1 Tax=Klebsiella spallanzanii TaxID=2587528 RepID=A0ABY6V4Y0_9ENTR|nr:sulfatase-like hydrolase/transferase [Klebsiella spallanzanii]VUS23776.1 Arylsulfatase [Klebsiella spallanzanii]
MNQPNILWICTDQQRWDTLSCLGTPGAQTPHIDNLAAAGVLFERAYVQSPICTPSRASFLTGMYPIAHQIQRNGNRRFPEHLHLLPRSFQQAGYRTGLIGKLHLSASQHGVEQRPDDGYDEFYWSQHPHPDWSEGHDYQTWLEEKGVDPQALYAHAQGAIYPGVEAEFHQTTWATERAREFISRHQQSPWFLSINLYDPHPPFDPPQAYLQRIDADAIRPPLFAESDLAHQARFTRVDQQTKKAVNPNVAVEGESLQGSHDTPPESWDAKAIRAAYFAMIAQIDDLVGSLTSLLDESGQRQNTLVIFMSDHGEMLGDHGLLYKGCRFYEGLVHVPLIVSWPQRFAPQRRSNALVELVDIPATLLESAGLPIPAQNQGLSLYALLNGDSALHQHKPYVLSEYFDALGFPGSIGSRASMYFDGRYKLIVYHDAEEGELFDLDNDPHEFHDRWHDPQFKPLKAQLIQQHFSAMMKVSGAGPERISDF